VWWLFVKCFMRLFVFFVGGGGVGVGGGGGGGHPPI